MSLHISSPNPYTRIVHDEHGTISERVAVPLALTLTAPRQARRILDAALAEWGLGHLAEAADLITSELVTNAVLHGDGDETTQPAQFTVYTDRQADAGLLFIELEDAGRALPLQRTAAEDAETGRGLQIVDVLAEDWGCEPVGERKRVWASLAIGAEPPAASRAQDPPTVILQRITA